ncbi:MAG: hypothetical protein OXD31_04480, partial [Chloroflexi bacterium]|nr:hypothetical protein [Chloroflexota bacterium]
MNFIQKVVVKSRLRYPIATKKRCGLGSLPAHIYMKCEGAHEPDEQSADTEIQGRNGVARRAGRAR